MRRISTLSSLEVSLQLNVPNFFFFKNRKNGYKKKNENEKNKSLKKFFLLKYCFPLCVRLLERTLQKRSPMKNWFLASQLLQTFRKASRCRFSKTRNSFLLSKRKLTDFNVIFGAKFWIVLNKLSHR